MTLSDGTVKGELNTGRGHEISVLGIDTTLTLPFPTNVLVISPVFTHQSTEPSSDEKIIGFYGHSDWRHGWGGPRQFGIITAPKDVELPDVIYDMEELKNTDGGTGPVNLSLSHVPIATSEAISSALNARAYNISCCRDLAGPMSRNH